MKFPEIDMSQFDYNLPQEKIALFPADKRSNSKLIVLSGDNVEHHYFNNIPNLLPKDSFLIFNNTRVIPARLLFAKDSGTVIEIFCLEPMENVDFQIALSQTKKSQWHCMVGKLKRWKEPIKISIKDPEGDIELTASQLARNDEVVDVEFSWTPSHISFAEVIEKAGKIPLPPYIKRDNIESDSERYQTVFAKFKGSVAAPTAGLHFTDEVLQEIKTKGIQSDFITLHVGAGTFKPVSAENAVNHNMHTELFVIRKSMVENLLQNIDKKFTAVGTTTTRALESLYWLAVKYQNQSLPLQPELLQWEAYELENDQISLVEALNFWLSYFRENQKEEILAKTSIMITPFYQRKLVKLLITNFHQPRSTLLLLLASFTGNRWLKLYQEAIDNNYRFLSYGDSCLILG
ncbi:MAG: S-adenosylmethionine:tRNA ribosyltransferase-isomerase [Bacteroidales bacterium]